MGAKLTGRWLYVYGFSTLLSKILVQPQRSFIPGNIMIAPEFASNFVEDTYQFEPEALVQSL